MTENIQRHTNLMANPATILPVILLILPLVSLAGELRSLSRTIDPIEISGSAVSDITGTMISNLRIIASRDGEFASIPFQIDQKGSENDWIWDSVINNETSSQIEVNTHDDQDPLGARIFDANDVVVFLAKDAGDKDRKGIGNVPADRLVELELTDPVGGGKGWVYLAYFESDAPPLSEVNYVQYDPKKHRLSGPDHEFLYSPNHTMILDDFRLEGTSVLKSNRIRGEVEAGFGPATFDFEFNEVNVKGYRAGYINGPVRVVKRSVEQVQLRLGMTSPFVNCDHFHYPWHAEIPVLISKQFPVRQVSILATSIFHEGIFTRVESDGLDEPVFISDRSDLDNLLLSNTKAEWIKLSGEEVSIITSVKIPNEHEGHLGVSPHLANIRDVSKTHNLNSVSGIEVGFKIKTTDETPQGGHVVHSVFLFSLNSNRDDQQVNAINLLNQKLKISTVTLIQ